MKQKCLDWWLVFLFTLPTDVCVLVNRESVWTARGGRMRRRTCPKGIWVWGRSPSWTSARGRLSAPELETWLQAAAWTLRKVVKNTQNDTWPLRLDASCKVAQGSRFKCFMCCRELRRGPSDHGGPDQLQLPGVQRHGVSVLPQGKTIIIIIISSDIALYLWLWVVLVAL